MKEELRGNSAEVIARHGVTMKTLRLYEKMGLLVAPRNASGWRVYGEPEIERLKVILALKELGMPISHVAALLAKRPEEIDAALVAQYEALETQHHRTIVSMDLIRVIRARLRQTGGSSPEDVARLARTHLGRIVQHSREIAEVAAKVFEPADLVALDSLNYDDDTALRISEGWARIHAEVRELERLGDPTSSAALDMARRMRALIAETTGGDAEMAARATRFWREAFERPEAAARLPITKPQWEFLHRAAAALSTYEAAQG
jgi:MerR family transcriptional regulator, thiopeptide resistance regulator